MDKLPNLHCLWIGSRLGWREQLCLSSWLAQGHCVTLWAYEPMTGVPTGVALANAHDVLPRPWTRQSDVEAALVSDWFRYRLLKIRDEVTWLDADVLLLRPLDIALPYVFGWEAPNLVCTAVLRLPCDSPVLHDVLELIEARAPVPPWWPLKEKLRQQLRGLIGRHEHHQSMKWGTFGPLALTDSLRRRQLLEQVLPREVFYPIHWTETELYFAAPDAVTQRLTEATIGVHLWNNIICQRHDDALPQDSWLAEMARCYNVAIPAPFAPDI